MTEDEKSYVIRQLLDEYGEDVLFGGFEHEGWHLISDGGNYLARDVKIEDWESVNDVLVRSLELDSADEIDESDYTFVFDEHRDYLSDEISKATGLNITLYPLGSSGGYWGIDLDSLDRYDLCKLFDIDKSVLSDRDFRNAYRRASKEADYNDVEELCFDAIRDLDSKRHDFSGVLVPTKVFWKIDDLFDEIIIRYIK